MKTKRIFTSRWFRFYDEIVDDPKIQTLGDKLGFFWMNCMCLASKHGGYLPSADQIAWKLRKNVAVVQEMLAQLKERGLLEVYEDGALTPHNWDARQYSSDVSTERVRRFRDKTKHPETVSETPTKRSETVSETVMKRDETVSETASDTDTDTEQIQSKAVSILRSARPSWQKDETYTPFVAAYREVAEVTGKPLIDEDFADAHFRWGRLDYHQKVAATQGVSDRLRLGAWTGATDPQYIPLPQRYLEKEYKRPVVAPKIRAPTIEQPLKYAPDKEREFSWEKENARRRERGLPDIEHGNKPAV